MEQDLPWTIPHPAGWQIENGRDIVISIESDTPLALAPTAEDLPHLGFPLPRHGKTDPNRIEAAVLEPGNRIRVTMAAPITRLLCCGSARTCRRQAARSRAVAASARNGARARPLCRKKAFINGCRASGLRSRECAVPVHPQTLEDPRLNHAVVGGPRMGPERPSFEDSLVAGVLIQDRKRKRS